ncbi:MAG: STAS domain-containing protein [Firmicutes bacterium]|nr:STAS domain-containing protein [Bacillota bacterium]
MSMNMDLIKHGNDAELKLDGYIDATNAPEVEKILLDVAGKFDNLTLDMENLEYVSSAGLRTFKLVYMELRRKGGSLSARNVGKSVMEVLEVTGFTRLFKFI